MILKMIIIVIWIALHIIQFIIIIIILLIIFLIIILMKRENIIVVKIKNVQKNIINLSKIKKNVQTIVPTIKFLNMNIKIIVFQNALKIHIYQMRIILHVKMI